MSAEKFNATPNNMGRLGEALAAKQYGTALRIKPCSAQKQCSRTVHVNLFFDGTANHRDFDLAGGSWTNVARLYDACEGEPGGTANELGHFYRFYLQGVGTQFKEIGEAEFSTGGKAFASGFGMRVGWAYTRLLNAIFHAMMSKPFMQEAEAKAAAAGMTASRSGPAGSQYGTSRNYLIKTWEQKLADAHRKLKQDPNKRPWTIAQVHVNAFGFSRGAACARAFINKLLTDWAPGGKIAGEFDYSVDFVGLFDTVASVGMPDGFQALAPVGAADGHWGWCADKALNIPPQVARCVHYFSVHEQRMNFPLDTIREGKSSYPGNRLEVAYPGVHSDVGGGYPQGDQGKAMGQDGRDISHKLGQFSVILNSQTSSIPESSV